MIKHVKKKKTKKIAVYVFIALFVVSMLFAGFLYVYGSFITSLFTPFMPDKGTDMKQYVSLDNNKAITVILHHTPGINYSSYIYVTPGKHDSQNLPDEGEYIKYPRDTGIYVTRKGDSGFSILSDRPPEYNSMRDNATIELIVNSAAIRKRNELYNDVIRYRIKQ